MMEVPVEIPAPSPISREPAAFLSPSATSAPNFNRLARIYRWLEYLTFGPFLQHCRIHFMPRLLHHRSALILGDGDGRFTARLLRENPGISIHAVDASPQMIECLLRNSDRYSGRLTTELADIRTWEPADTGRYDLIVTHFFLDCLSTSEIEALAQRLAPALLPDALWLVSEFATPPTIFGRALAAPLVAALYRAFRLITGLHQQSLPDHPSALAASGWSLRAEHVQLGGLLLGQLWQFSESGSASPHGPNPSI